jgi:tetratricopeptide (TPR) repeat protein
LRPDFTLALLNLGFIAKSQGRLDEAELLYKRAIECDVDGIEARANLAHLYVDQERFSEAADLFESVREVDGDLLDIELGYLLSLVHLPNQDWPRCQSALVQLKKLLGDWTATEADFMRTDSAALRMGELGALLLGRELTKCAERALSVAIALNGELLDVRRLLAEVHFALGKHWAAIAQLEAVLTVEPTDTASFGRLGDCYAQLGVNEAAQMCYARAGSAS